MLFLAAFWSPFYVKIHPTDGRISGKAGVLFNESLGKTVYQEKLSLVAITLKVKASKRVQILRGLLKKCVDENASVALDQMKYQLWYPDMVNRFGKYRTGLMG